MGAYGDLQVMIAQEEADEAAFIEQRDLELDAARWRYARRFLSVADVESWSERAWRDHVAMESENVKADKAVDAAMTK